MNIHRIFIAIPFLLFSVFSCSKDKEETETKPLEVQVKVNLIYNAELYNMGDTLKDLNGYDIVISKFKFYLSEIKLQNDQNKNLDVSEVELVNIKEDETYSFTIEAKAGSYSGLTAVVGLNHTLNDKKPEDFSNEHPLSIYSGMYWSMLKYRFAIVEGRANVAGSLGSSSDYFLAYHPGTDAVVKSMSIETPFTLNEAQNILELNVDLTTFFTGTNGTNVIDFTTEAQTHSATAAELVTADKVMTNLAASLKVK